MSSVSVSIVNYRTASLVVDCLTSLAHERATLRGGKVVVVDNDSQDGSAELVREQVDAHGWAGWVELIEAPRNGGFAYGNNIAFDRIREVDPGFCAILLLNPDTVVRPGLVDAMVGPFRDPKVGIVGGSIENVSGVVEKSSHDAPSLLGELEGAAKLAAITRMVAGSRQRATGEAAHRCDWVSGACMAIRREVVDEVGAFDEGFFLYFEEVDYCTRARARGWQCWFTPRARIMHLEGAATGIKAASRRRPAYWYESRRRYWVKHHGVLGLLAADMCFAAGRSSLLARRALGLGGQASRAEEPTDYSRDLLVGDWKALRSGALARIPRRG